MQESSPDSFDIMSMSGEPNTEYYLHIFRKESAVIEELAREIRRKYFITCGKFCYISDSSIYRNP